MAMGIGGGGETVYEVVDSRVLPQHDEDWYAWRISRQVLPVDGDGDGDVAYAEATKARTSFIEVEKMIGDDRRG